MQRLGFDIRKGKPLPAAGLLGVAVLSIAGCTGSQADSVRQQSRSANLEQPPAPHATRSTDKVDAMAVTADRSRGKIESIPLLGARAGGGEFLFETLDPKEIGIDFQHVWARRPGQVRNNTTGCGVAMGDYDGDGRVDVFLPRSTDGGKLYRNLGEFRFADVTQDAGIFGEGRWTTGATFVDIDNDGDLDLYVCGFDCPNHLYINQGDGKFQEMGRDYGLDFTGSTVMMAFADYDRDGDLDAYLVTNHMPPDEEIEYNVQFDRRRIPRVPEEYQEYHDTLRLPDGSYGIIEVGQYDHLYRNNGDGTFSDQSKAAGISGNHKGLGAVWWDYNHDRWPDLYVANDFYGPDILYHNNGDGTFTDTTLDVIPHSPWFSMGCDVGDLNNDGWFDFMGTDMSADTHYRANVTLSHIEQERWFLDLPNPPQYMRNVLYLATGTERVLEAALLSGLDSTNWTWSTRLEDLDQDGRVDVHITNGMSLDETNNDLKAAALKLGPDGSEPYWNFWLEKGPLRERNLAFRNLGGLRFENVSKAWGLDHLGVSFGAALGDLDGDGDLDLVINNFQEMVSVYRNTGTAGHAVRIRLKGRVSNRWGIGAVVRATVGEQLMARYLTLSRGFMSASDPTLHFGLGSAEVIDHLEIAWPSGQVHAFDNLPADRLYTITEPSAAPPQPPPAADLATQPLFAPSKGFASLRHRERPFDDFARQPLLSFRLSELGPGIAVGDVDSNGHDDLFLGGAADDWGSLVLHEGRGVWTHSAETFPAWSQHADREDMGALFLDADSDGDLDLYVVSGGVESDPGDEALRDRLYLNDGKGIFSDGTDDHLPDLRDSGSVVAAADYDRDGDLDLYVGSRCIAGQYPETPSSRLLNNTAGLFRDATADDAAALMQSGLVTSALWTDVNGDGWIDLLVTHEWGPIKLFVNDDGRLRDATQEAGLADYLGWWNSIAGRDFDRDGDIDYVAANLGRNTPYRVTAEEPARLFYGDFTGSGKRHVLEGKYDEHGRLVPRRTKPIIQEAMPFVEVAFPLYHDYASATLADLVGDDALKKALQLVANTVDSVILWNDGQGTFVVEPLPALAQIAPGFGVLTSDFDADGRTDVYLVQNSYAPRPEIGRFDGGLSVLLQGQEDGRFEAMAVPASGLIVPGDAKSAVIVDLNGDVWPDIVVGANDGETLAFNDQGREDRRMAAIRLEGQAGNPTGVGSRVTVIRSDGVRQTAEVQAGGGYLSQQAPTLYFGLGADAHIESVEIRWPDGQESRHRPEAMGTVVTLSQPDP